MARTAHFFAVPAGTRPSQCSGRDCRATVYWIETDSGKRMLVDCDVDGGAEPTGTEDGQGVAHFGTCPNADDFRRRR
jgi:hypothetical protein